MNDDFKKLKTIEEFDLSNAPEKIENVTIPMAMTPPSVKGRMKFFPPKSVTLVGVDEAIRYGERIAVRAEIEMPRDCLQDKDHWDERESGIKYFILKLQ